MFSAHTVGLYSEFIYLLQPELSPEKCFWSNSFRQMDMKLKIMPAVVWWGELTSRWEETERKMGHERYGGLPLSLEEDPYDGWI